MFGPSFCTTANQRVYITIMGREIEFAGAAGLQATGASGLQPSAKCGRMVLYSIRHHSITICASFSEQKISPFKHSSRIFPLKLSQ